jgi:hypothetical protein
MVTFVYICNKCEGDTASRTFDVEFVDLRAAEEAAMPKCPKCGGSKHVSRFYGHNIFCPAKSNKDGLPARFVPTEEAPKKAVVALGMRVDEGDRETVKEVFDNLVDAGSAEFVDDPNTDIPGEKLGLKKGTLDRALFDIRQKHLLEELAEGKKISGFFLPISGETEN